MFVFSKVLSADCSGRLCRGKEVLAGSPPGCDKVFRRRSPEKDPDWPSTKGVWSLFARIGLSSEGIFPKGFVSGEEETGIRKEDQEPENPGGRPIPQRSRMRVKLRER